MRALSLLVAAVLAVTGISILPAAGAEPGYECADGDLFGDQIDPSVVRLSLRRDCSLELVVFEGIICVGGWGGKVEQDVLDHTVRVYYCDGGLGGRIADLVEVSSASAMPGCAPKTYETSKTGTTHRVELHHNCRSDITLNEGVICLGGSVVKKEIDVLGASHITIYGCGSPDPTFPPDVATTSAASAAAEPCKDQVQYGPGFTVYQDGGCNTRVDIQFYDCVWNCGWTTVVKAPKLTVRYYTQNPGGEPASAAASAELPPQGCPPVGEPGALSPFVDIQSRPYTCEYHVELFAQTLACAGPLEGRTDVDLGQFSAGMPCGLAHHGPDPTAAAASADVPPPPFDPCPIIDTPGPIAVFVDVEMDKNPCFDTRVKIGQGVACTEPLDGAFQVEIHRVSVVSAHCGIGSEPQLPPVSGGVAAAAASAPPSCDGIWYKRGSQTLPTGTTVSYGTNLQPDCTTVRAEHGGLIDCTADLKPHCEDIWINWMSCLWGGSYTTVKAGVTNVHIYTCSNGPPSAAAAAATPVPAPTCGIVYHEYTIGPATVGESAPCVGLSVDPFDGFCVQDRWVGAQAYTVSVAANPCTPHFEPPGASAAGVEYLPVCWGPRAYQQVGWYTVDWRYGMSCGTITKDPAYREEIDPWDCLGGGSGYAEKDVLWYRVHIDRCSPPPGTLPPLAAASAAQQPDWCPVRDDTPTTLGVQDRVWGGYDEGPDGECDVDVEPVGACLGGGGKYSEKRIGPVHLKILVCGPGPGPGPIS